MRSPCPLKGNLGLESVHEFEIVLLMIVTIVLPASVP